MLLVHLFVCFVRVHFCHLSLPLGVGGWLRFVIVDFHGLFYSLLSDTGIEYFILLELPCNVYLDTEMCKFPFQMKLPEGHWSCIAHRSAEDISKSAVIDEKKYKHSPWAGADNPLGQNF